MSDTPNRIDHTRLQDGLSVRQDPEFLKWRAWIATAHKVCYVAPIDTVPGSLPLRKLPEESEEE